MSSLVRYGALIALLLQLLVEACLYFGAAVVGVYFQRQFPPGLWTIHAYGPALVFSIVMVLISAALGLYRIDGSVSTSKHMPRVAMSMFLGFPAAYMALSSIPYGELVQNAIVNVALLSVAGGALWRPFFAAAINFGLLQYRILVVGSGPEAQAVDEAVTRLGLSRIVGASFYPIGDANESLIPRSKLVNPNESLKTIATHMKVDEIVVAVREQRGGTIPLGQLLDCRANGVKVTGSAQFLERIAGQVPLESVKASGLIYADGFEQGTFRSAIKRLVDVAVSLALLVLTLPIMLVAVAAIFLESGGPIIYRQTRVGRGGRPFTLLKFRSMRSDAESDGQPKWAQKNDSRVTEVGKIMRRTRIDELPQLINVLRGEMSFVGPRPERPPFVDSLRQRIPFYDLRHCVKPGITGWAQVQFQYAATQDDAAKKLQFDLYYVKNNSLVLDLLILLDTARVVVSGDGAR